MLLFNTIYKIKYIPFFSRLIYTLESLDIYITGLNVTLLLTH